MSDSAVLKRKLIAMIAVDAVCLVVAIAAIIGYVTGHIAALGPVFVAAIAVGVATQIWFIVSFARMGGAAKNASAEA